jgi:hypothetical protein
MESDNPAEEKIPVVYVLSTGRSGSTLLELLLGSSENTWTLGEAQILPWELKENRHPCGCGAPVAECDFWREVLPDIPVGEGSYPIEHFRESHTSSKAFRWHILSSLLFGHRDASMRAGIREYGDVNAKYFSEVRAEAENRTDNEIRWLVDASKDHYRLLWLDASDRFDLRVVFLTKSPQAYAYSRIKSSNTARLKMTSHATVSWTLINALMYFVCRQRFQSRFIHLHYRDLAANPDAHRSWFQKWLDTPFPTWHPTVIREYGNHGIAGNQMRWSNDPIRLDEAWTHQLTSLEKGLARGLSPPLAGVLGY